MSDQNKGYVIRDRRRFDAEGEVKTDEEQERGTPNARPHRDAPLSEARPAAPKAEAPRPVAAKAEAPRPVAAHQPVAAPEKAEATRRDAPASAEPAPSKGRPPGAEAVDFSALVLSVATNAMMALGASSPDDRIPGGRPNLPAAAQNIEILLMLEEKTRGNLTQEELELIQSVLYDLRMQYVSIAQSLGLA
jgi:hypothetical protein